VDPAQRWTQMTGGKDIWVRSEITDQRQQMTFDFIARMLNVSNGRITRQQYLDWSQQMRARFPNGGGRRGGQQSGATQGQPSGQNNGSGTVDAWAEVQFRRLDRNGDGLLNYDEMPEQLRAERDKWDKNKDGAIDLAEFKEYLKARAAQRRAESKAGNNSGSPGQPPIIVVLPTPEEEQPKHVVYRTGHLPKEAQALFTRLDTDHDGQIGLYEWKYSGQPLEEFFKMDRNSDGFVTVEEYLHYIGADKSKPDGGSQTASAEASSPPSASVVGASPSPGNGPAASAGGRRGGYRNPGAQGGGRRNRGGDGSAAGGRGRGGRRQISQ
jgi:Ca2+-binding EF-hand superfamily protein